jgi:cell division septal protein FtsQ
MAHKKKHHRHAFKKLKPKRHFWSRPWFWIILFLLIIFGFSVYGLFFWKTIQIESVTVSGNQTVSAQSIQSIAEQELQQPLFGIPFTDSHNFFIVKTAPIQNAILANFPLVGSVAVTKQFPNKLFIAVHERAPVGVYCGLSGSCFAIDESGVLFQPLQQAPQGQFIILQPTGAPTPDTGEHAVDPAIMKNILAISADLQQHSMSVEQISITNVSDTDITTSGGWHAYFDLSGAEDFATQLNKLDLLLSQDFTAGTPKGLQYIDVRFGDKAYYK